MKPTDGQLRAILEGRNTDPSGTSFPLIHSMAEELLDLRLCQWQPIESAPKDGTAIVAWNCNWPSPMFVCWKTNPRTGETYFGDPYESDDYELAKPEYAPTHWHPLASLPSA